jgi:hypothetical protein
MKHLKIIFLSAILFLFSSCGSDKEILSEDNLEGEEFYYFQNITSDNQEEISAQEIKVNPNDKREDLLQKILIRLSEDFSRGFPELQKGGIKFKLNKITEIKTESKNYMIAVININDPAKVMERGLFPGINRRDANAKKNFIKCITAAI